MLILSTYSTGFVVKHVS